MGKITRRQMLARSGGAALAVGFSGFLVTSCSEHASVGSSAQDAPSPRAVDRPPNTPFDPQLPAGKKPSLPRRIALSLPAGGELFTDFSSAVTAGAHDHQLDYLSAQANGDSATQFQQTQQFLSRGIAALGIIDLAPPSLVPLQLQAIKAGVAVMTGPYTTSTCQFAQNWYAIGQTQGQQAVKWIQQNLGGRAQIVIFNQDDTASLKPRAQGTRDALAAGGAGIKVVEDIGSPLSEKDSFDTTRTILQRHPDANVWIGKDTSLSGVTAALTAAGRPIDKVALFGTDGDAQALEQIVAGGPYKLTVGSAYAIAGYAWTAYTADWLDGKSIPLVLDGTPIVLDSKTSIDAFKRATAAPGDAFRSNASSGYPYFKPLGNTSYSSNSYLTALAS